MAGEFETVALEREPSAWNISGNKVFPANEWNGDPVGKLVVFEEPQMCRCQQRHEYGIGVDIAGGLAQQGGDLSIAHVYKKHNRTCPNEQVAELALDVNPFDLPPYLNTLGRLYTGGEDMMEALMAIECNMNTAVQSMLRTKYEYSNFHIWKRLDRVRGVFTNDMGWWTTPRTRNWIVDKGIQAIRKGYWVVHSPWFIDEMEDFVKDQHKMAIRAAYNAHDDRLMAGFIINWCMNEFEYQEDSPDYFATTAKELDQREQSAAVSGVKADFCNTVKTYDEMFERDVDDARETLTEWQNHMTHLWPDA